GPISKVRGLNNAPQQSIGAAKDVKAGKELIARNSIAQRRKRHATWREQSGRIHTHGHLTSPKQNVPAEWASTLHHLPLVCDQANFCRRRRAKAIRPPQAAIRPGKPAPTMGPGTARVVAKPVPDSLP